MAARNRAGAGWFAGGRALASMNRTVLASAGVALVVGLGVGLGIGAAAFKSTSIVQLPGRTVITVSTRTVITTIATPVSTSAGAGGSGGGSGCPAGQVPSQAANSQGQCVQTGYGTEPGGIVTFVDPSGNECVKSLVQNGRCARP
jgi:hypothetical protein